MCRKVTDRGLASLAQQSSKRIRELHLYDCQSITDAGVLEFAKSFPDLSILDVYGIQNISLNGLQSIMRQLPRLVHIEIEGCDLSMEDLEALRQNHPSLF